MAKHHTYRKKDPKYKEIVGTRRSNWRRHKLVRLSEAQGHRCAYCCGETYIGADVPMGMFASQRATLEHLIPQSVQVQTNKDENLVMACDKCNALRGLDDPLKFYNRLRRYYKPQSSHIQTLTAKAIAKQKIKDSRALALCFIAVMFWPAAAVEAVECFDPRKSKTVNKHTKPFQINEIAKAVTSDPLRMAA